MILLLSMVLTDHVLFLGDMEGVRMVGIVDDGICEAGAHDLLTSKNVSAPSSGARADGHPWVSRTQCCWASCAARARREDRMRGPLVWLGIPSGRTCRRPRSGPVDRLAQNTSSSAP